MKTAPLPDCRERLEAQHQACFDYNFTGADIDGTPRLDRNSYRECLKLGFEDYIAEVRSRERETHALQQQLLN